MRTSKAQAEKQKRYYEKHKKSISLKAKIYNKKRKTAINKTKKTEPNPLLEKTKCYKCRRFAVGFYKTQPYCKLHKSNPEKTKYIKSRQGRKSVIPITSFCHNFSGDSKSKGDKA